MKNEQNVPQVRFKGFTDAWEQRKLGDHSEIVAGGTPNTGHPEYWNPKEIPWMSSGEINNKVIYSTDNMISKIGFSNSSAKWVKEKSVLIALAGQGKTRGTVAISEIPLTTNQSIAAIQPDSFLYYKFLFQNLEGRYNELREVSSGDGTRGGLNKQIISDLEVLAPEIQEQIKIGDFLCGIDNIITLHQRKCDTLQKLKKSMLQKLFPKNGSLYPEIRFTGFTDAWEQRELGKVITIRNEKNGDRYSREDVLAVSDAYGCVNQIKFHGRSFAGEDISNYKVVRTGDIVYTKSPLQAKPYGIIKIVGEETGIVSPLYVVNETVEGIDSLFMYYLFDTPERTNNYLSPLVRKGAKNTMNISNDEWLSGIVTISSNEQEQQQIGTFFRNLDNLITLHQRKLETLKKLKKSMLQKMFI